jgi:hypothetical protein
MLNVFGILKAKTVTKSHECAPLYKENVRSVRGRTRLSPIMEGAGK